MELLVISVPVVELGGALETGVLEGLKELVVEIGAGVVDVAAVGAAEELTTVDGAAVVLADAPVPKGTV